MLFNFFGVWGTMCNDIIQTKDSLEPRSGFLFFLTILFFFFFVVLCVFNL